MGRALQLISGILGALCCFGWSPRCNYLRTLARSGRPLWILVPSEMGEGLRWTSDVEQVDSRILPRVHLAEDPVRIFRSLPQKRSPLADPTAIPQLVRHHVQSAL